MLLKIISPLFLTLLLSSCSSLGEEVGSASTLVIIGATLEQPGDAPITPSVVIVEGTKFRNAGSQIDVPIPPGSDKMPVVGGVIRPLDSGIIRAGSPANLVLTYEGGRKRIMKEGRWID